MLVKQTETAGFLWYTRRVKTADTDFGMNIDTICKISVTCYFLYIINTEPNDLKRIICLRKI